MTDRRDAVAKAIRDALPLWQQARGVLDPTGKPPHWSPSGEGTLALADAALAAMDAEPTDAEIAAARQEYTTRKDAYIEQAKADGVCLAYSRDDYPECVEMIYENAGHEAMRAALMAARKARP
jgi:hypothetical protein